MRTIIKLVAITLIGISFYSCDNIKKSDLQDDKISIIDHFSNDTISKRALFIFAHGDDETACAGTILKLKENNYNVGVIILTNQGKEIRHQEFLHSMKLLDVDYYKHLSLKITNYNSWNEIIEDKKEHWKGDTVRIKNKLIEIISDYNPSIVFTWDNKVGLYGHPDHILLSQLVNSVFDNQEKIFDNTINIENLYMITLSKGLENHILKKMKFYDDFLKRYNEEGIPNPDVAVKISNYAVIKKDVLLSYKSEYKSALSKFFPKFKETDAKEYFELYDREYYIVKNRK
jgi:LmbE family N-acetylglucosaminyl deacetylase